MFLIIQKPVNWFALQINWLVSVWMGTLVDNGLIMIFAQFQHNNLLFLFETKYSGMDQVKFLEDSL